jgi:hypothetical protein
MISNVLLLADSTLNKSCFGGIAMFPVTIISYRAGAEVASSRLSRRRRRWKIYGPRTESWSSKQKALTLDNEDTDYKRAVFDLCNEQEVRIVTGEFPAEETSCGYEISVIFDTNWRNELNRIFRD